MNRGEVGVGERWGAKHVTVGAKKFVKIFLFICERVTGNFEDYLNLKKRRDN